MKSRTLHRLALVLGALLLLTCAAVADVKLASLFGDHMVLQQDVSVPIWGTDSPGENISVTLGQQRQATTADAAGKWMVRFSGLKPGKPLKMVVRGRNKIVVKDILVGEVWLAAGQSNMEMMIAHDNWERAPWGVIGEEAEVAAANWPQIRMFTSNRCMTNTPQTEVAGQWEITTPQTISNFSATAYFFGRDLHHYLKVPIGLVVSAYGGSSAEAWIQREALEARPELRFLLDDYVKALVKYATNTVARVRYQAAWTKWLASTNEARLAGKSLPRRPTDADPDQDKHSPCVLFNAMIAPLVPYAVRGIIWYQGESNGPSARHYKTIMETLIANWRQLWGDPKGDLPFIYTQIAGWGALSVSPTNDHPTAYVRDEQRRTLTVTNTGMAVTIDTSNPANIHPKNKQDVGRRLALIAKAKVYGGTNVYSGPLYDSMTVETNTIRLRFQHVGQGLTAAGKAFVGFTIAGEDRKFFWADAKVDGDDLVVSSLDVPNPVAVRYAWGACPIWSLFNKDGLPASPFRTDDW